ncbi:hypothetical protein CIPAW_14G079100 [Carya illinoinensis]|uniref:Uncharacterized protein n=1 Tax=Carya illinoinensis TaxID=32201 RepID=A0A8T1NC53_CARIL|nr:hypothetical protein CIPAW_14G079100 [Carya illinoinensis]
MSHKPLPHVASPSMSSLPEKKVSSGTSRHPKCHSLSLTSLLSFTPSPLPVLSLSHHSSSQSLSRLATPPTVNPTQLRRALPSPSRCPLFSLGKRPRKPSGSKIIFAALGCF